MRIDEQTRHPSYLNKTNETKTNSHAKLSKPSRRSVSAFKFSCAPFFLHFESSSVNVIDSVKETVYSEADSTEAVWQMLSTEAAKTGIFMRFDFGALTSEEININFHV